MLWYRKSWQHNINRNAFIHHKWSKLLYFFLQNKKCKIVWTVQLYNHWIRQWKAHKQSCKTIVCSCLDVTDLIFRGKKCNTLFCKVIRYKTPLYTAFVLLYANSNCQVSRIEKCPNKCVENSFIFHVLFKPPSFFRIPFDDPEQILNPLNANNVICT